MRKMEASKFLPPKFSECFGDIAQYFAVPDNYSEKSDLFTD